MKKVIRITETELNLLVKKIIRESEIENFDYEEDMPSDEDDIEDYGFDMEDEPEFEDEQQKEMIFRDFMRKNRQSYIGIGSGVRWEKDDEKPYNPIKPSDMPLEKYLKYKKLKD